MGYGGLEGWKLMICASGAFWQIAVGLDLNATVEGKYGTRSSQHTEGSSLHEAQVMLLRRVCNNTKDHL